MAQSQSINIIPDESIKSVHVSQGDIGRRLVFNLFEGSTEYYPRDGAVVRIRGTKPSGYGYTAICTLSGNVASVETTEGMTDEYGNILSELQITVGDTVLGTANFILSVEKNPHPDSVTDASIETAIQIETRMDAIESRMDAVEDAIEALETEDVPEVNVERAERILADANLQAEINTTNNDLDALELTVSELNAIGLTVEDEALIADTTGATNPVGSPLLAFTSSDMTDSTKIYVYVGSETGYTYGNWYYYDGSAWASGGVYNALVVPTDTTLSTSGMPADAKVVGDELTSLKEDFNGAIDNYALRKISKDVTAGYYTAGGSYVNDEITFTNVDFFSVDSEVPIRFIGSVSTELSSWAAINYFDENKNFISRVVISGEAYKGFISAIVNPPSDASFAKFSYRIRGDEWIFDYYYIFDETKYKLASNFGAENFIRGRLSYGDIVQTGENSLSRIVSFYKIKFDYDITIYVDDGYAFALHTFDSSGAYDTDTGWKTGFFDVPKNKEFRIMIRTNPASDNNIIDVDDAINAIHWIPSYNNSQVLVRGGHSSGAHSTHQTRAITANLFKYDTFVKIKPETGYQVAVIEYKNGTFFYDYYWRDLWIMPDGSTFRLLIQRTDGTAVNLSDDCFTIEEYKKNDFNANIQGVAHRGLSSYAPENTLLAYDYAKRAGFNFVETDIQFTSDDVPVLLHETYINDVALNLDGSTIDSTVYISDITYSQALQYTFNKKAWITEYIPITTFDEFMSYCKYNGLKPYVELKTASNLSSSRIANLFNIVKNHGMQDKVKWISFNETLLELIRTFDANCAVSYCDSGNVQNNIDVVQSFGDNASLDVYIDQATDNDFTQYVDSGINVEGWTLGRQDDFSEFNSCLQYITNNWFNY